MFLSGRHRPLFGSGKESCCIGKRVFSGANTYPYYFSSLSEEEIREHRKAAENCQRNDTVLVIGQYFDYKGMDIALEAAGLSLDAPYEFVGMGSRTELFLQEQKVPENVEVIPFLQKKDLEQECLNCAMLVLPSRKESWGLLLMKRHTDCFELGKWCSIGVFVRRIYTIYGQTGRYSKVVKLYSEMFD